MTERQIDYRMRKLAELEAQKKDIDAQIDNLKAEITGELGERESLETGRFIIRWAKIISNRFDSKLFKADHAALYGEYTKPCESRRFSYATK